MYIMQLSMRTEWRMLLVSVTLASLLLLPVLPLGITVPHTAWQTTPIDRLVTQSEPQYTHLFASPSRSFVDAVLPSRSATTMIRPGFASPESQHIMVPSSPSDPYSSFENATGPYADRIFFSVIDDPTGYLPVQALQAGLIDMVGQTIPTDLVPMLLQDPNIEIWETDRKGYGHLVLNCETFPFNYPELRRALAYAFDKEGCCIQVHDGFARPLDGPLPTSLGDWSLDTHSSFVDNYYEPNPAKGNQLLDDAGWLDRDGDGIRESPTGTTANVPVFGVAGSLVSESCAAMTVDALTSLGIKSRRELYEFEVLIDLVYADDFQCAFYGLIVRDPRDLEMYTTGHSWNTPNWMNSTYDEKVNVLLTAPDYATVLDAALSAQQIFWEEVPTIPLYQNFLYSAHRSDPWTNYVMTKGEGIFDTWTPRKVYLKPQYGSGEDYESYRWSGDFTVSLPGPMVSQNPLITSDPNSWAPLSLVYDTLTGLPHPYTGEAMKQLGLAYDWDIYPLPDKLRIVFYLLDYATWHDGTPVTAEDVAFSYEYIQSSGSPHYADVYSHFESCTVINSYTVEILTTTPSYFALKAVTQLPILPKHIWEPITDPLSFYNAIPIGFGPYKWRARTPGELVILERFDDYFYGANKPSPPSMPFIYIDGNDDFDFQASWFGWQGSGESDDPYVIEGLTLDRAGTDGSCIEIRNTDVYFRIQHCTLTGATRSLRAGIHLYNVSNAHLFDNTCRGNTWGILIQENLLGINQAIVVEDNQCGENLLDGIAVVQNCRDVTLRNNNCTFNHWDGIWMAYSPTFYDVIGNNCSHNDHMGIRLNYYCNNGTFLDNICESNGDDGISITGDCHTLSLRDNHCNKNNYAGIYINDSSDNFIYHNTLSNNVFGLYINNTINSLIEWNDADENTYGIVLNHSQMNRLYVNNLTGNTGSALRFNNSHDNTLWGNNVRSNYRGFYASHCDYNLILNNFLIDNDEEAILLTGSQDNRIFANLIYENAIGILLTPDSTTNTILRNTLEGNTDHAHDDGTNNGFDFNYFDDYTGVDGNNDGIGDTPHPIPGLATNADPRPNFYQPRTRARTYAPFWLVDPLDQTIESGEGLNFQLYAYDLTGLDEWWLGDTTYFTINWNGLIRNTAPLPVGEYTLEVRAYNAEGDYCTAPLTITVYETTPPTLEDPLPTFIEVTFSHAAIVVTSITAYDESGIDHWTLTTTDPTATSYFALSVTTLAQHATALVMTTTSLQPGTYELTLTAADPFDNSVSHTFQVQVVTRWNLELSGSFDYLLKEEIYLQLAGHLHDADTGTVITGAYVEFALYGPDGLLLLTDTMTEQRPGTYVYTATETLKVLDWPKGIYLVICEAALAAGESPQATAMLQFHIDPPSEPDIPFSPLLLALGVAGIASIPALTGFLFWRRQRHNRPH